MPTLQKNLFMAEKSLRGDTPVATSFHQLIGLDNWTRLVRVLDRGEVSKPWFESHRINVDLTGTELVDEFHTSIAIGPT